MSVMVLCYGSCRLVTPLRMVLSVRSANVLVVYQVGCFLLADMLT